MVTKRKYARRKSTRRTFRPRTGRKKRILRPETPVAETVHTPEFDYESLSVYPWRWIVPMLVCGDPCTSTSTDYKLIRSLRQLCASTVATNANDLTPDYLDSAPWSCWKQVWTQILQMGTDSPEVFRLFAEKFGSSLSFHCHDANVFMMSLDSNTRAQALQLALIPFHKKHRIENIFKNVSVVDFAIFASRLDCSIVIDCSGANLPSSDLLLLASMQNIVGLDLSGNHLVDDQFLYTIRLCLLEKNVNLKILRLSGCSNVTEQGISYLMNKDAAHSLCYIETDVFMLSKPAFTERFLVTSPSISHRQVPNTKWKLLDEKDPSTKQVANYSLAYKLHYLLKNTDLVSIPSLIWDFKFFPQALDVMDPDGTCKLFEKSWTSRLRSAYTISAYVPYCYLKDPKQDIVVVEPEEVPMESAKVFPRQGRSAVNKKHVRKPKRVCTDANTFFGLGG